MGGALRYSLSHVLTAWVYASLLSLLRPERRTLSLQEIRSQDDRNSRERVYKGASHLILYCR